MSSFLLISLSRILDYSVLFIFGIIISLFSPVYIELYTYFLFILLIPLIWIPIETFFIYKWKMTFGNYLFGIKLNKNENYCSTFKYALKWKGDHFERFKNKIKWIPISALLIALLGSFSAPHLKKEWEKRSELHAVIEGWVNYLSPEGMFRANFPIEPLYELKELNISIARKLMTYHAYTSYLPDNVAYSVSYVQLPSKWRFYSGHTILKAALNLIPENGPVSKVVKQETSFYKKYPSLNFHLMQKEEEVFGRLVLVNGILFKITSKAPLNATQEIHREDFFDTFQMNIS
jgi:hypothetical protein